MLQRAQNQPKNLAQLKRALTAGAVYRVIKHYIRDEYTGQMRVIQQAGSTVFYSGIYGEPDSDFSNLNYGKGIRSEFNSAKDWNFSEIITMTYHGKPIMEIEIMEEVAEAPTEPETVEAVQDTTCTDKAPQEGTKPAQNAKETRRYTIYVDGENGIDSRGAYTTRAEARMRLSKELDEDETSKGGFIYDEVWRRVTAIYNGFNLDKIPEQHRGTPDEYTTRKEREALRAMWERLRAAARAEEIKPQEDTTTAETEPQSATESAGTVADNATRPPQEIQSRVEPHRATKRPPAGGVSPRQQKARRKTHRRTEPAKAGTLPPHPIQSHHEPQREPQQQPVEMYHRATAQHAQQPHRATKAAKAYNATTDHRKRHTEPYREPAAATTPTRADP